MICFLQSFGFFKEWQALACVSLIFFWFRMVICVLFDLVISYISVALFLSSELLDLWSCFLFLYSL